MANTFKRTEKKTTLPSSMVDELKARIAPYVVSDPHNVDGKPYMICNLYYDGLDDHVIRESVQLPKYKEKLRLRCYGTPTENSKVFLELKKKQDGMGTKRRAKLRYGDLRNYLDTGIHPKELSYVDEQVLYTYSSDTTSLAGSPLRKRSTKIWYITAPFAHSGT